eukprot:4400226-Pleurochrysis_carterae.AAC.1
MSAHRTCGACVSARVRQGPRAACACARVRAARRIVPRPPLWPHRCTWVLASRRYRSDADCTQPAHIDSRSAPSAFPTVADASSCASTMARWYTAATSDSHRPR